MASRRTVRVFGAQGFAGSADISAFHLLSIGSPRVAAGCSAIKTISDHTEAYSRLPAWQGAVLVAPLPWQLHHSTEFLH